MAMWEYRVTRVETVREPEDDLSARERWENLHAHMSEMDSEGWELVNGAQHGGAGHWYVEQMILFWRRPRSEAPPES